MQFLMLELQTQVEGSSEPSRGWILRRSTKTKEKNNTTSTLFLHFLLFFLPLRKVKKQTE